MTELVSGAAPGARIVATVTWYDVAKGYGFLTPGGGLPDIFCHGSALQDVGLDTLLQGATVTCEVVQGDRGTQVARIHAVDFSTASVIPTPGNGRMREDRVSPQVRLPSSDRRVRALVKWFVPTKGYGFLVPEDGSADIFCHGTVVQASGYDVLLQGAMVTCEVVEGRKGVEASRILAVDVPANVLLAGKPRLIAKLHRPWARRGMARAGPPSPVQTEPKTTDTAPGGEAVDASCGPIGVPRTVWTARGQAGACPPPDHTRRSRAHRSTADTTAKMIPGMKRFAAAAGVPTLLRIPGNPATK